MKKILSLVSLTLLTLVTLTSCGAEKIPQYDGYKLLWHDEFNGTKLNEKNWNKEERPAGWTNHELQAYTTEKDNIFVKDGKLVLKAIKQTLPSGSAFYTSGKVQTSNKKDFTYGKIQVRAKTPKGQGLWPAIWMMPTKEQYGNWPVCGEIDIMEVLGNEPNKTYGTIHFGAPHGQKQGTYILDGTSFADDFHIFEVDWEPGEMRWSVDGNVFYKENSWFATSRAGTDFDYPAPFNQDFYIQLNLAVGGDWPGKPSEDTDFNKAEFLIDYVRVYQKTEYDLNVTCPTKPMPKPDQNGNYIHNGDFANAENLGDGIDWTFLTANGGRGEAFIKDNNLIVKTEDAGKVNYSIQIIHPNIGMKKGKKYKIQFDAKADQARTIQVAITAPEVNWMRYFHDKTTDVGTTWKTISYEFEMTDKDDPCGRLEFNCGSQNSTATLYFKNVTVSELD